MTTVTIQIDSRETRLMLLRAPSRIDRALRAAMEDSTALLLREQRTYPPKRAGSAYVRTENLMKSWSRTPVRREGSTLVAEVGSNRDTAPYHRYVQDATMQASIHRGRWTNTVQETTRRNQATIQRYFDRRLREEFSR